MHPTFSQTHARAVIAQRLGAAERRRLAATAARDGASPRAAGRGAPVRLSLPRRSPVTADVGPTACAGCTA